MDSKLPEHNLGLADCRFGRSYLVEQTQKSSPTSVYPKPPIIDHRIARE
jgi:hypothetical protein